MSPMRKWWFVGGSVLLLAGCAEPAGPTLLNTAQPKGSLRITTTTTGSAPDPDGYGAAWKPDGSTLAFATTRYLGDQIALLNVAGGGVTRAGLSGFGPSWSPDGTQLAFAQTLEDCGGGWDYSRPAASSGTGSARLRRANSCYTYDAISVAHSDGSNPRVFTTGNQPAWRPHP